MCLGSERHATISTCSAIKHTSFSLILDRGILPMLIYVTLYVVWGGSIFACYIIYVFDPILYKSTYQTWCKSSLVDKFDIHIWHTTGSGESFQS